MSSLSDFNWKSAITGLVAGIGLGFVLARSSRPTKKVLQELKPDGAVAKELAACIPYYPYKKIPRFYDIQGLLSNPEKFELMVDIFVERYRKMG